MVLTSVMASGGLVLAACDAPSSPASSSWINPPAVSDTAPASRPYASLQECKDANVVSDGECDTSFAQAQNQAPQFSDRQTCEERYGVDQCVPRNQAGGGSVFMPLVTGFLVGQALSNMGGGGYYGRQYPGRDDRYGGYAGNRSRDYVTGRPSDSYSAPARVQSRSSVISRGGFGGGGGRFGG
jgi:uncharacterized protein YgiB involved in biofilm formation